MMRKLFLFAFLFITLKVYAIDLNELYDTRLNGTSWVGVEYGLYGRSDKEANYKNNLLLFDVKLNFVEDEVAWHDGYEWDQAPVTICKTNLSKTTDKKALKVWKKMWENHQDEIEALEQAFTNQEMRFDILRDSSLLVSGLKLKFRIENDYLFVDLKRGNDASISLYNSEGALTKTIHFCNDFSQRNTNLEHGMLINEAIWTYWIEGSSFCFCFGDKNTILRCPYKMSADGNVISLQLHIVR